MWYATICNGVYGVQHSFGQQIFLDDSMTPNEAIEVAKRMTERTIETFTFATENQTKAILKEIREGKIAPKVFFQPYDSKSTFSVDECRRDEWMQKLIDLPDLKSGYFIWSGDSLVVFLGNEFVDCKIRRIAKFKKPA